MRGKGRDSMEAEYRTDEPRMALLSIQKGSDSGIAHQVSTHTAPPANGRFNRTYPGSWRRKLLFEGFLR